MIYMDTSQFIGILIAVASVAAVVFAAIGYYACARDEERRQQKVLDTVVVKAHTRPINDPKSFAMGAYYQKLINPPSQ